MKPDQDRRQTVKQHFDTVNARWGDLYDPSNPLSHGFISRLRRCLELLGDLRGKRLLDLGCGTGVVLQVVGAQDCEYEGIDVAPKMIEAARQQIQASRMRARAHVREGNVESLPYAAHTFDAVLGMGLLEYFDEPRNVIREALRVSKPDGILVFTIPRRGSVDDWIVSATGPARAVLRALLGRAGQVRRDRYTEAAFRQLFADLGCVVVGERFYNKLVLPYPFTRMWPRLAQRAAALAEDKPGLERFATGYIVACSKVRPAPVS